MKISGMIKYKSSLLSTLSYQLIHSPSFIIPTLKISDHSTILSSNVLQFCLYPDNRAVNIFFIGTVWLLCLRHISLLILVRSSNANEEKLINK